MSADFWAGYVSGAVGILIGNPLDIIKVRLQATGKQPSSVLTPAVPPQSAASTVVTPSALARLSAGTAAPVLGYGALNALLFVSYHRSETLLKSVLSLPAGETNLWTTWIAGAAGGLATWVVSAPTEIVKCRAQLAVPIVPATAAAAAPHPGNETRGANQSSSSWRVARQIWATEGLRGFYFGGGVTALRDSVGYGFYFWSYQLATQFVAKRQESNSDARSGGGGGLLTDEALRVLLCGGIAGIVTWASIFPLDVIKTRMQAQVFSPTTASGNASMDSTAERRPLLGSRPSSSESSAEGKPGHRLGAVQIARDAYRESGIGVFFRGLGVCSVRAFIVNAVQWAVYEWIMFQLVGKVDGDMGVKSAPRPGDHVPDGIDMP